MSHVREDAPYGLTGARKNIGGTRGRPYPVPPRPDDEEPVKRALSEGIPHLDDLSPEQFVKFLDRYLSGKLQAVEKIDGAANVKFTVRSGRLLSKTKHGTYVADASTYHKTHALAAVAAAHRALDGSVDSWPDDVELDTDVLTSERPNTLGYGPDAVVVHVVTVGGRPLPPSESRALLSKISSAGLSGSWRLEFRPDIDPETLAVELQPELSELVDLLPRIGRGRDRDMAVAERFAELQRSVADKMRSEVLPRQRSAFGGGDVEGIVFRDLGSGDLTKLVDRDFFTKMNKHFWRHREMARKGVVGPGGWEPGIMSRLWSDLADGAVGSRSILSPGIVGHIVRAAGGGSGKSVDLAIAAYVREKGLMPGEFLSKFRESVAAARKSLVSLRERWTTERDEPVALSRGRSATPDAAVHARTEEEFGEVDTLLAAMDRLADDISGMDPDTQRVAVMKVILGKNRLAKLAGKLGIDEAVKPKVDAVTGPAKLYKRMIPLLSRHGLDVSHVRKLGDGSHGTAYDIGAGRVVKVTDDKSEAIASFNVMNRPEQPNIVKVYDVFAFPAPWAGKYGIVQELLEPLDEFEAHDFKNVSDAYMARSEDLRAIHDGDWRKVAGRDDDPARVERSLREFEVPEIISQLQSVGVKFHDFHAGNLMKRGDRYVIADLGQSQSPAAQIPVLEDAPRARSGSGHQRLVPARGSKTVSEKEIARWVGILGAKADKLVRRGVRLPDDPVPLGVGTRGAAFETLDGKILKVTNDASEANVCLALKKRPQWNIVRVEDVFAFPDDDDMGFEIYGILEEKLRSLSAGDWAEFNKFIATIDTGEAFYDGIEAAAVSAAEGDGELESNIVDLGLKYGLDDMSDGLKAVGVKEFADFHSGNIMRRGKDYVLIDPGYSFSGRREPIPVLEGTTTDRAKTRKLVPRDHHSEAPVADDADGFDAFREPSDEIKRKVTARGHDLSRMVRLGNGSYGTAYAIGNSGRVIKFTTDDSEAMASFRVQNHGKHLENVVRIYDVFRLGKEWPLALGFGIVQERLRKLSGQEAKEVDSIRWIVDAVAKTFNRGEIKDPDELFQKAFSDHTDKLELVRKFKIAEILKQLVSIGVKFNDFHSGNLMIAGSEYVVTDLGVSQSPHAELPVLETAVGATKSETAPVDENLVRHVLVKNSDLLAAKKGIAVPSLEKLGKGTQGVAFGMGSGRVLKVTQDRQEALASNVIRGKKLKHVVEIYDVFRFKDTSFYGIIEERLQPLPAGLAAEFREAIRQTNLYNIFERTYDWDIIVELIYNYVESHVKKIHGKLSSAHAAGTVARVDQLVELLEKTLHLPEMIDELKSHGIKFVDFHPGNLMKRGSDYVVIDLGYSAVQGGREPEVLEVIEGVIRALGEARADKVGVTIGRFQPFHRGHATLVRRLARTHDRVVVFVAGLHRDERNPFSFELRKKMMEASLPDVVSKLEIVRAEVRGVQTGFLPTLLSDLTMRSGSSVTPETAVEVLVGPDRYEDVKKQVARSDEEDRVPPIVVVRHDQRDEDGFKVREILERDDLEAFKKVVDPHLVSNPDVLSEIYRELRGELGVSESNTRIDGTIVESIIGEKLDDVGGEDAIMAVLVSNSDVLMKKKHVDVRRLKKLGSGEMGVAYDIGNRRVLKVTTDEHEARNANYVRGKSYEHIGKVFDVFRFRDETAKGQKIYGIEQEFLTNLSADEKAEFDSFVMGSAFRNELIDVVATANWDGIVQAYREFQQGEVRKDLGYPEGSPPSPMKEKKLQATVARDVARFNQVMSKFSMPEIVNDLRLAGIQFADFHGGNLMKRDGKFVINDLGGAKSAGGEPPILETLIRELTDELVRETFSSVAGVFTGAGPVSRGTYGRPNTGRSGSNE